jgi:antitoxin (DNA-binding transcriptional repressor) of toxin-antitoxin stability system
MPADADEVSIEVTAFKARCLALIDDVARGKTRGVVLMKHNRPVAAIAPMEGCPDGGLSRWRAARRSFGARVARCGEDRSRYRSDEGNPQGLGSRYLSVAWPGLSSSMPAQRSGL